MRYVYGILVCSSLLMTSGAASAQPSDRIGTLSCDVSKGIGMFVVEKQTLICTFRPDGGGPVEDYTGTIDQFGVELGGVTAGHLIWGVIAASKGLPAGALAGSYAGVGANASFGVGAGANILVGGTGRAFSLQPLSVQGQTGVNIAGGVTTVTLVDAP
jgi:hypothetical protein